MTQGKEREFPEWAEKERSGDFEWIGENLHVLWPAAQLGYQAVGRGAVVCGGRYHHPPHRRRPPLRLFSQQALEQGADPDTQRLVREYDPSWEMVTSLLKTEDRPSRPTWKL